MVSKDVEPMRWPLAAAQQDVWIAQRSDPINPRYYCGGYLDIQGMIDISLFKQAVHSALEGAEVLRVRFV